MVRVGKREDSFSSPFELIELIASPNLGFAIVIAQIRYGSCWLVSFLNVALVALVDVIVERVFHSNCVVLLSALDSHGEGTDDGFV